MPNRTLQPNLVSIDSIEFVAPKKYAISNSVPLYHMSDVPNETARFDLYFDAGNCRDKNGLASFVNGLLLSGTESKTSVQIQSEINSLGGFLDSGISVENSVLSVYCLREHVQAIFTTVVNAIALVSFDQKEIDQYLADRKQNLLISKEKVGYLAQQKFRGKLFASNEYYAASITQSEIDTVTREQLITFHADHYLNGLTKMVVVGDISEDVIEEMISQSRVLLSSSQEKFEDELRNTPGEFHQAKDGAVQSAIRAGRILFNKNHPDYLDFLVLNTILGDYFGSRLMANIREDKGYTYGIGTMVAELDSTGYFLIATEVGAEVREPTMLEIQRELRRLQEELVPNNELQLVQNYMLGQLLKSADGPYAMTDLYLSAEIHGKELDFYNQALTSIKSITPERIQSLAKKYLQWDDFSVVSVG